ncbi:MULTISPECIES: DUF4382 domain-containing protein [Halorubrum]|uniref:DUF4382 domain-containing protein n=1 Tax=Halorubrum hochstenium ATCC 700873 TaxID=1227481 RepID=M0F9H7_9EURY|nr:MULTISPECIES: DUF4382 domain-containing protein [Halorubrum]ELZ55902.1 hypothetical protein C467_08969 [Halorubrum hochstenium ATCC 700873]
MTDRPRTTGGDRTQDDSTDRFRRREFVALGAGASATLLAGCAGADETAPSDGSDGSDGSETLTGNFRLLISDAPADIGDFDELNVTLSEARIFESQDDAEDDDENEGDDEGDAEDDETEDDEDVGGNESDPTGNETETGGDSPNGTEEADEDDEEEADGDGDEEEGGDEEEADGDGDEAGDRGYAVVDLDGATVDLTQVIEDDAIAVFDGELPAGSYEKIELDVSDVQGIVDGNEVEVKLPSEKLQITNGFEVTPDEPVSFVFDINVVKRGPNNGYILRPVISGSGVAGRDVEVNEIDEEDDEDEESEQDEESEEDDPEEDDATGGNQTDDGGNQTDDGGNQTDDGGNQTDDGGNQTASGN